MEIKYNRICETRKEKNVYIYIYIYNFQWKIPAACITTEILSICFNIDH